MNNVFINFSNHPSTGWNCNQELTAHEFAGVKEIKDIPFPTIDPHDTSAAIDRKAYHAARDLVTPYKDYDNVYIHIMGEMSFVAYFLKNVSVFENVHCVCSTTERIAFENADGTKTSKFVFCKFREYPKL